MSSTCATLQSNRVWNVFVHMFVLFTYLTNIYWAILCPWHLFAFRGQAQREVALPWGSNSVGGRECIFINFLLKVRVGQVIWCQSGPWSVSLTFYFVSSQKLSSLETQLQRQMISPMWLGLGPPEPRLAQLPYVHMKMSLYLHLFLSFLLVSEKDVSKVNNLSSCPHPLQRLFFLPPPFFLVLHRHA